MVDLNYNRGKRRRSQEISKEENKKRKIEVQTECVAAEEGVCDKSLSGEVVTTGKECRFQQFRLEISTNTPRTAGCPGGHDRTLAIKSRKTAENSAFFFVRK